MHLSTLDMICMSGRLVGRLKPQGISCADSELSTLKTFEISTFLTAPFDERS